MTDEAMLAQIRKNQEEWTAICQRLLGRSGMEASAIVEPLGYFVEVIRLGSDVALTADMRSDRVRLFVDGGYVVEQATVGSVTLPQHDPA